MLRLQSSAVCTDSFSLWTAWRTLHAVSSGSRSSAGAFRAADRGLSARLRGPSARSTRLSRLRSRADLTRRSGTSAVLLQICHLWNVRFQFKSSHNIKRLTRTFPAFFGRWPIQRFALHQHRLAGYEGVRVFLPLCRQRAFNLTTWSKRRKV